MHHSPQRRINLGGELHEMKLTKSQRLFMSAGDVEYELICQKCSFAPWDDGNEESAKEIKRLKDKRKKIIRLAIDAQKEHECIMSLSNVKILTK